MPRLSMIAAVAENLAIGKNNALLWHIPEDLAHFKRLTSGHTIIMGENTYRSIGRPLPNRTNIVVSDKADFQAPGAIVVHSKEEALAEARKAEPNEIFVIGGARVYREFLSDADRLYLTQVKGVFDADTFFPEYSNFQVELERENHDNGTFQFSFVTLERGK